MAFRVYRVRTTERAKLDAALGDDILSRQSLQVRDGSHFGRPAEFLYLFVEGADPGVIRADALLSEFAERAPDEDELYAMLKAEEDEAASSLGSVFGDV